MSHSNVSQAGARDITGPLLELTDVRTYFRTPRGLVRAVDGVSFTLERGKALGIVGESGSGKTILSRSIMGLLKPSAGSVSFAGRELRGQAPNVVARAGIALVPEGRQVFPNLSVEEHLTAFHRSSPSGVKTWTPARALELFPRLAQRRGHLGAQLSGGEQQMLAIARALVTNPLLLILDEATEGLAPLVREEIWKALAELRRGGHAIIVIDKYVQRLVALADRAVIVEKGRIAWRGSAAELAADRTVWQRLLGV